MLAARELQPGAAAGSNDLSVGHRSGNVFDSVLPLDVERDSVSVRRQRCAVQKCIARGSQVLAARACSWPGRLSSNWPR